MNCEQTPVGVLEHGIGFNWYDGYRQSESDGLPTYPDLKDEAGWQAMLDGLDDLNPGLIRFGLPPDPCVGDAPGTIETGNNHLQRLERIARWAEARRCNILLDPFCIPKRYQFQETPGLQAKYKWLHMAAENNRAYAREFVVPLLKHVVEERGLSAVKLFNPHNEPLVNGPYTTPEDGPDA
ncbi:MAG: hypothetical protein M1133_03660, partial [Armatimonadetes bacterium]|nr:hypothetical protein [Armatimonadota bacterium]